MLTYKLNKWLTMPRGLMMAVFALIFVISAMFLSGTAYASDGQSEDAALIVKEVWLTGDTLHISVADDGEGQTLELNLRDYAMPSDEYVTVQASDSEGRTSNSVSFKNPYYQETATSEPPSQDGDTPDKPNESAVPDNPTDSNNPFTPDGTGSVLDNATDGDGKEFFTVETPDGNMFYLIVDRQRDSENVYLLNAVNEEDLASLAKTGNGKDVSAIPTPEPTPPTEPQDTTAPELPAEPTPESGVGNNGMLIFIGIAVAAIGGAAYYIKIVRPKKDGADTVDYDEPEDDFDDDDMVDLDPDDEDGEDE